MFPGLTRLPLPAPQPVLALGAWLKNSAGRLDGAAWQASAPHGDLDQVDACLALERSVQTLTHQAAHPAPLAAIVHDLHPDFPSTRLAQALAAELKLPAIAVQHHRAHIGVVQAEQGLREPVLGLALDGVGLGSDGQSWGGELLWVDAPDHSPRWRRLAHLAPLALPGGDQAAREPWRLAAAALHALGRADQIAPRFGAQAGRAGMGGDAAIGTLVQMLDRGLNCPPSSAAGRWFDAAAAALGLWQGPQAEAQAAIALEREATAYLQAHPAMQLQWPSLDLLPLLAELFDLAPAQRAQGAARFHLALVSALSQAAIDAAHTHGVRTVVLAGGCFHNTLLREGLASRLRAAGLQVALPGAAGCGDLGLSLGQAWAASWALASGDASDVDCSACASPCPP